MGPLRQDFRMVTFTVKCTLEMEAGWWYCTDSKDTYFMIYHPKIGLIRKNERMELDCVPNGHHPERKQPKYYCSEGYTLIVDV